MSHERGEHTNITLNKVKLTPHGKDLGYQKGHVLGDLFYLADKPSGVEPGFIAVQINQAFVQRLSDEIRLSGEVESKSADATTSLQSTLMTPIACIQFMTSLEATENKNASQLTFQKLIQRFADKILAEGMEQKSENAEQVRLPLWLIKQDYQEPTIGNLVAPPKYRLGKTNAIQEYPDYLKPLITQLYAIGRSTNRNEENINAILECVANDIAIAGGMHAQTQKLCMGSYQDNFPKVMTACLWETGLEGLQDCYAGSRQGSYENYLVEVERDEQHKIRLVNGAAVFKKDADGHYLSAQGINDLGENYPLLLVQGDRDLLGSKCQNKGTVALQVSPGVFQTYLFGFDFGHAFRSANTILDSLTPDFHFKQPSQSNKNFKNVSVFDDTPLSERMKGIFYLFKMTDSKLLENLFSLQERIRIIEAIEAYRAAYPSFARRFDQIEFGAQSRVFDKYEQYFRNLAEDATSETEKNEYLTYLDKVREAKQIAIDSTVKMLMTFSTRLQINAEEVDILNHLEWLTAETTAFSADGKVKLNELRVIPETKLLYWDVSKEGGILTFKAKGNLSDEARTTLNDFFHDSKDWVVLILEDDKIAFQIVAEDTSKLASLLDKGSLLHFKEKFKSTHPEFAARRKSSAESSLMDKMSETLHQLQQFQLGFFGRSPSPTEQVKKDILEEKEQSAAAAHAPKVPTSELDKLADKIQTALQFDKVVNAFLVGDTFHAVPESIHDRYEAFVNRIDAIYGQYFDKKEIDFDGLQKEGVILLQQTITRFRQEVTEELTKMDEEFPVLVHHADAAESPTATFQLLQPIATVIGERFNLLHEKSQENDLRAPSPANIEEEENLPAEELKRFLAKFDEVTQRQPENRREFMRPRYPNSNF